MKKRIVKILTGIFEVVAVFTLVYVTLISILIAISPRLTCETEDDDDEFDFEDDDDDELGFEDDDFE